MRLSRTDFVPLTAIIAGGAIGASLTFGALVSWSPADDVPAPLQPSAVQPVLVQPFAMHPVPVRPAPPITPDELSIVFEDFALEEQLSRLRQITERLASDIADLGRERRSEILEQLELDILERIGAERARRDISAAQTVTLQN